MPAMRSDDEGRPRFCVETTTLSTPCAFPPAAPTRKPRKYYINFMCETQIALANCEFIGYSTPQVRRKAAARRTEEQPDHVPVRWGAQEYRDLQRPARRSTRRWTRPGATSSYDRDGSFWLVPTLLGVAVVLIVVILWRFPKRQKEAQRLLIFQRPGTRFRAFVCVLPVKRPPRGATAVYDLPHLRIK